MPNWTVNPQCVGQAPTKIARMAGFEVPAGHLHHLRRSGRRRQAAPAFDAEKLSPVLSLYWVKDFAAGVETCHAC
jgi:hypothetical protein